MTDTKHGYALGTVCWFIAPYGRWYRVKIVAVDRGMKTFTFASCTGYDDTGEHPWPYPDGLEVVRNPNLYKRMRPLEAREPGAAP